MVADKVMAKCDAIDGLKDGLIDDPRKCSFNPAVDVPACSAGADGANCLTAAQAEAIAKIYSGPVSNGKPFFTGYMPGSEAVAPGGFGGNGAPASGWMNVIVAAQPAAKPADFNLAENTMQYLVPRPPKPDYDYKTFDFDRDIHLLDYWSKQADAKNPDLSKFRKHGGKLLMTHGWADPILQPMMSVKYYEQAVAKNGPDDGGLLPPVHGARHGPLRWRDRSGSPRPDDGDHRLGGKGQGAGFDRCQQGGQQPGGAHATVVRVPASGALFGPGQHRRCGQFPLRSSLTKHRLTKHRLAKSRASHPLSAASSPGASSEECVRLRPGFLSPRNCSI